MRKSLEIKLCGINDKYSMATALECKVEYIGLVFFKNSPRNVSIELSKKLLENRNTFTKIVALTVNPDDDLISKIMINIKPDFIQLHGNETPERCLKIKNQFKLESNWIYITFSIATTYILFSVSQVFGRALTFEDSLYIFRKILFERGTLFLDKTTLAYGLIGVFMLFLSDLRDEFFPKKILLFNNSNIIIRFFNKK